MADGQPASAADDDSLIEARIAAHPLHEFARITAFTPKPQMIDFDF
jgi:hypothetical protein